MQKYRRVALKDRIEIQSYLSQGLRLSEIANSLGFHKSTISREVERNKKDKLYTAVFAQQSAVIKRQRCQPELKIKGDFLKFIKSKLQSGWSPEQISGRLKLEGSDKCISHQSIYRYLETVPELRKKVLRFGYKRRGFGRNLQRQRLRQSSWKTMIRDRPKEADLRLEIGHWERDLFFASHRKTVLILADRKSRYVMLKKNPNFKSEEVAERTNELLKRSKAAAFTMTNDNGSEFFDIKSVRVPVYFCEVLKPQQRGTIENSIGLLRQYIKKDTNLDQFSDRDMLKLERKINLRPRKCLDYKTPYEVFYKQKVALGM